MKIGDYIRTKYGISKIIDIKDVCGGKFIATDNNIGNVRYSNEYKGYVVDCLPNLWVKNHIKEKLIDLIEVGDYVNGEYVTYINKKDNYIDVGYNDAILRAKNIKSIVTKEQFESMEYKVGD